MPGHLTKRSSHDEAYFYLVDLHAQQRAELDAREGPVRLKYKKAFEDLADLAPQPHRDALLALGRLNDTTLAVLGKSLLIQGGFAAVASLLEEDVGLPQARQAAGRFASTVRQEKGDFADLHEQLTREVDTLRDLILSSSRVSAPPSRDVQDRPITLRVDTDEWIVIDNAVEAARQGILKKTAMTTQALTRSEDDVARRITEVRDVLRSQADEAIGTPPPHTQSAHVQAYDAFLRTLLSVLGSVDDSIMEWMADQWRRT